MFAWARGTDVGAQRVEPRALVDVERGDRLIVDENYDGLAGALACHPRSKKRSRRPQVSAWASVTTFDLGLNGRWRGRRGRRCRLDGFGIGRPNGDTICARIRLRRVAEPMAVSR